MKKVIIFVIVLALVLIIIPAMVYAGNGPKDKATGEIWMDNPDQHIKFNAHDCGIASEDKGQVEYWNYEYVGGLHYTA